MTTQNIKPEKTGNSLEHQLPHLRFYSDEFVFDTVSGMFYRLSPTAGLLLRSLYKGTKIYDLINLIETKYDVSRLKAVRDVELFLNDLAALGILNPSDMQTLIRKTK